MYIINIHHIVCACASVAETQDGVFQGLQGSSILCRLGSIPYIIRERAGEIHSCLSKKGWVSRQCECFLEYKNLRRALITSLSLGQHCRLLSGMAVTTAGPSYCEAIPPPNLCICDIRDGNLLDERECLQAVAKIRDLPFSDGEFTLVYIGRSVVRRAQSETFDFVW